MVQSLKIAENSVFIELNKYPHTLWLSFILTFLPMSVRRKASKKWKRYFQQYFCIHCKHPIINCYLKAAKNLSVKSEATTFKSIPLYHSKIKKC